MRFLSILFLFCLIGCAPQPKECFFVKSVDCLPSSWGSPSCRIDDSEGNVHSEIISIKILPGDYICCQRLPGAMHGYGCKFETKPVKSSPPPLIEGGSLSGGNAYHDLP